MTTLVRGRDQLARWLRPRSEAEPPYGWDRITTGAALLDLLDPAWWRADAVPPIDLATLNMASTRTCLLAQRCARPGQARPQEGLPLWVLGLHELRVPFSAAADYGFAGPDADLLTPGWRQLIAARRADPDSVPTDPFQNW